MNKGINITKIIALILVTVLLSCLVFTGIPLSKLFGVYDIKPIKELVKLGFEFNDSTIYTIDLDTTGEVEIDTDNIVKILNKRLKAYGVSNYKTDITQDGKLTIKVPKNEASENLIKYVIQKGYVSIQNEDGEVLIDSDYLLKANQTTYYVSDSEIYPAVSISFSEEGTELLSQITASYFYKTINIKLDEATISSPRITSTISNGEMYLSVLDSKIEAQRLSDLVNSGYLKTALTVSETSNTELGASTASLKLLIYLVVGYFIIMILFYVVFYRMASLPVILNLIIYFNIIILFFAYTNIVLSWFTFLFVMVCFIDYYILSNDYLKTCKKNVKLGKTLIASLNSSSSEVKKYFMINVCIQLLIGAILFCVQKQNIFPIAYIILFSTVLNFILNLLSRDSLKAFAMLFAKNNKTFIGVK